MSAFIPPLMLPNPPLRWRAFVAVCLVTVPVGFLGILGYMLWCRWMWSRERTPEGT